MASCVFFHPLPLHSAYSSKHNQNNSFLLNRSQFVPSLTLERLKRESLLSNHTNKNKKKKPGRHPSQSVSVVAAQSNLIRVIQTVWKVAKDGIEAGTNLVPASIPRPIARVGVAGVALTLSLFVLKSFLSTAFFALATMGLVYFVFLALNKDEGPKGGGGSGGPATTEESLEEARRIMEKYK